MKRLKSFTLVATAGLFSLLLTTFVQPVLAAELTLKIVNIDSDQGNMRVAVYADEAAFDKRSAYRAVSQPAVKGEMKLVLSEIPPGNYGVMLFQDVNGNEVLETNLFGIPQEPWSASLGGSSVFGAPGWSDVIFTLPEAGAVINIDMQ